MDDKMAYFVECSRTAREELLFRVKHRDSWLRLQLYVQTILWALANGIKFVVESPVPIPSVLTFALPISFVLVCLYYVEDGLISKLSIYLGTLSELEKKISNREYQIQCWDNSCQLKAATKGFVLKFRVLAQIGGFIILPSYLAMMSLDGLELNNWQIYFQSILFLLICCFVVKGFYDRKGSEKSLEIKC
ncbi:MAG: hypothetical protein H6Q17_1078 [Bacteroidetes bacterium]|nr:hypothetical protein [Bacteroidota bacterium]